MNLYQVRPTEMGWELEDQQTQKTVLRTLTKDEMYSALDAYMDGRTASVECSVATANWKRRGPIRAAITCRHSGLFGKFSWSISAPMAPILRCCSSP